MTPLFADLTRCYGHGCPNKQNCQRFTTLRIDPPLLLSYMQSGIDAQGGCELLIPVNEKEIIND